MAKNMTECAVVRFFQDEITKLQQRHGATHLHTLRSEVGPHPIYELEHQGQCLAVFHPGIGAPLAAGLLDAVIELTQEYWGSHYGEKGLLRSILLRAYAETDDTDLQSEIMQLRVERV